MLLGIANFSDLCIFICGMISYVLLGTQGHKVNLQPTLFVLSAHLWLKNCRELMPSSYNASRFDQPVEASVWLKNFRITNERFLKQMKTQQKYIWSKREFTDEGHPLIEVIDQGLTRVKNASDSVGIVLKELKAQCQSGTFKLVVGVDGVNALWGQTTLRKEDKSPVYPGELTLIHNLRKLMKNDWDGFDFLDPFLPIQVTGYSEREFESCYQYYKDRHWIQHEKAHTEDGKKELIFLSNRNPAVLERICSFL
uniref:Small ribosomal subunit protein mS29 n=1 Tax=Erpetoichthys calabaricus TaxID=27687 RepID=A0A8C4RMT0_ERPCA